MKPFISVIIPVYNSCNTLDELYSQITKVFNDSFKIEIILVDDGSKDLSFERMSLLSKTDRRVKAIRLDGNFGQQNAIMCGLNYSKGEYVVTMDDDLQHPPQEIHKLYEKILMGYDAVYGIPQVKKHSLIKNIGSIMTDRLFNLICGKPKDIRVSSFRIMTRSAVDTIIKDNTPFVYISAIALKNKMKIGNVTVVHNVRKEGTSGYSLYKLAKLFFKLYIYYSPMSSLKNKSCSPQYIIKDMD
ncbi:undecaprenyl-phosphate 4-deoxy-4-formamido-L-arabinose transferase [Oxobacter pfennigii]|uniref:Undecaprenyl-phosphate 4-deoxy-4-formamido-L-arabinose transferase n=1 Tax=Oxobacter pfennigii TaxID=36849 RepID=A0A0P8WBL3_9CLOT|nr:glycosyltransferase family 2 protein [Oxobacter pfennigii]KPU45315.1 undecaprenyl-phosphate 4-deoxy-4-formamido-L-arabinose transferase [Oxobacter pfennigii]